MILSVVVVIASDTVRRPAHAGHLRVCLQGLREQRDAPALDVVVPHLPGVRGLDDLVGEFPEVRFLEAADLPRLPLGPYRDHHDDLRSRGIRATTGPLVALLEDHEVPDPRWAAGIVAAHAANSRAAIGGVIENAIDRPLNNAVCLCDFANYLHPIPEGLSSVASDVNVSYRREALEDVRDGWRGRFNERRVHEALLARGHMLALAPGIVVYQRRVGLGAGEALVERFTWGRSYAATRAETWGIARRLLYAIGAVALPAVLVARITRTIVARGRLSSANLAALPWIAVLSVAWSFGECVGYISPHESRRGIAAGTHMGSVQTS
jgi:hypothetical protein